MSYFSIVDLYCNVVVMIIIINYFFGVFMLFLLIGVIFNNEMDDFVILIF